MQRTSTNGVGNDGPKVGILEASTLQKLIDALHAQAYQVIGPTLRDSALVYDTIDEVHDLPVGWRDEQGPAHYRLVRRDDDAFFGFAVGPHAWKRFLFPPERRLWQAARHPKKGFTVDIDREDPPRQAFFGVRPCELASIAIQDRVFIEGPYPDPVYAGRRKNTFIVAVQCGYAAETCFCTSMETGPAAGSGYDLALTEILEDDRHVFFITTGSEAGRLIFDTLPVTPATTDDAVAARAVVTRTATSIQRTLQTDDLHDLLQDQPEFPQWEEIADRCLSCANCTLVCPTCFCSTVEDVTDLSGQHAERWQKWDSCFTLDFSYIHGGSVRSTVKSRYRQWLTHKLSSWIDQFGTSGCVGCGRCITWCPVGIDLTEEVPRLRENAASATVPS